MDFLGRRWAPLAAPPAPPPARSARQGGVQRRSKKSARTSRSLCVCCFFFLEERALTLHDLVSLESRWWISTRASWRSSQHVLPQLHSSKPSAAWRCIPQREPSRRPPAFHTTSHAAAAVGAAVGVGAGVGGAAVVSAAGPARPTRAACRLRVTRARDRTRIYVLEFTPVHAHHLMDAGLDSDHLELAKLPRPRALALQGEVVAIVARSRIHIPELRRLDIVEPRGPGPLDPFPKTGQAGRQRSNQLGIQTAWHDE